MNPSRNKSIRKTWYAQGKIGAAAGKTEMRIQCLRRGSNPYALRHRILSPACLPIPPLKRKLKP